MTCHFSPLLILQIRKYSSVFSFPWASPSVNSQWHIQKNECSDTTYGHDFDLQLVRGLFRYIRHYLWYANQLRNGMQCACASADFVPLSWNTTALSQSNFGNFSCSSISKIFKIIAEIPNSQYCSDICFLWIGLCIINVWGYTEILPFWKKRFLSRVRLELLVYTQTKKQINRLTVFWFAK